jgi:hypothetical protein
MLQPLFKISRKQDQQVMKRSDIAGARPSNQFVGIRPILFCVDRHRAPTAIRVHSRPLPVVVKHVSEAADPDLRGSSPRDGTSSNDSS